MKRLSVAIAGSGKIHDIEIAPGTTAGDVLNQLRLPDYLLSKSVGGDFFAKTESVYDKVNDGEKVFASTKAEVGAPLTVLNIRYNEVLARINRASTSSAQPVERIERQQAPYWQEHGWTRQDNIYQGNYTTPFGVFEGWIEQRFHQIDFYIKEPANQILNSPHGVCFQPRNDGWFYVHMRYRPRDVSSGITAVERVIADAYRG